jgi:hypothetical protein
MPHPRLKCGVLLILSRPFPLSFTDTPSLNRLPHRCPQPSLASNTGQRILPPPPFSRHMLIKFFQRQAVALR